MLKFGTGGWRAIIGDEFIKSNVVALAQAIADDMTDDNKGIVIGYDRRFLSDIASKWAAEVFAANGITVHFINKIAPTPLVMFTVKQMDTKYGMAVTASHNPAEYNGIKVFTRGGRDADVSVTRTFEERIKQGVSVRSLDFSEGVKSGIIKLIDPTNEFLDSIIDMINMDAIKNSHLKILLDPMYGVSRTSLQTIFMTARCEVDIINDRHDTLFGGKLPSPSASTLSRLRELVVEKGYDIGIGTDGDADRVGVIDDNGTFIHPNKILALLSYYLLKYKGWRGDIVRNVATTSLLDKIAEDFGQKCHEVPVGFKYISGKMEEVDALIGGESSGGLSIRGHIKGKDGIFASALLVEMICVCGKKISEILAEIHEKYGETEMSEFDTKFSQAKKEELIDTLFTKKELPDFGYEIDRVSYDDGCKVFFKNGGWIIARFSGTEPLLRIFCEMNDMDSAEAVTDIWVKALGLK
ncbi:MAG: phosphoglucomutase/phosphomannomutase family protein [Ruminococcaceae bacterium]|nr:phosphoglucomutase/phosphomannomutase family protein [Oscillospiraceae bacterium]